MNNNKNNNAKPWLSLQQQVELLKNRGMQIGDEILAMQYLSRIGYYRLSGYFYPFRKHTNNQSPSVSNRVQRRDDFENGVSFKDVVDLYIFDKKLRLLVIDALERIEIAMRFEIAYFLGEKDRLAYLKPRLFDQKFIRSNRYQTFIDNHNKCVSRSKEEFIKHHQNKGYDLPIWVACEIWDFGMLSHLFAGMKPLEQTVIANKFGLQQGRELESWLKSLSILRNLCAHHSRVWNKGLAIKPIIPNNSSITWLNHFQTAQQHGRVFILLCVCTQMLKTICPNSSWRNRLIEHLKAFPAINHPEINLAVMGICNGWEETLLNI